MTNPMKTTSRKPGMSFYMFCLALDQLGPSQCQLTPILLIVSSTFPAAYTLRQTQKVLLLVLEGDSPKKTAPCSQHQWLSISFASHQSFSNFPQEAEERQRHCGT